MKNYQVKQGVCVCELSMIQCIKVILMAPEETVMRKSGTSASLVV